MRDARSGAAKAVRMLDLLIEFFDDGKHWIRHDAVDRAGNRCLVGAMGYIGARRSLSGARTGYYLRKAMGHRTAPLDRFNDACREFGELRELILNARKLAVADVEKESGLRNSRLTLTKSDPQARNAAGRPAPVFNRPVPGFWG